MNSFSFSKFTSIICTAVMAACSTQVDPGTATPTSFVPILPTSTPKTEVITTENISQLVLLKRLNMGAAHGDPIYLPDGKHIIQATTSGVYNFDITSFPNGEKVIPSGDLTNYYGESINISPDGKILVAGDALFNISNGHRLIDLERPSDASEWEGAYKSNFSTDGSMVARSYENAEDWDKWRVAIWRISDGELLHTFETAPRSPIDFSADSHWMTIKFVNQRKPYIYLYDLQSGQLLKS